MPEYQSRLAAARSVPAEAVDQAKHLMGQELSVGLRPSQVPASGQGGSSAGQGWAHRVSPQPRSLRPSRISAWPVPSQPHLTTVPDRSQVAAPYVAPGWLAQAKLAIGAPKDRWEQEADRVADAVVGGLRAGPARREAEENWPEAGAPAVGRFSVGRAAGPGGHSFQVQASYPRPGPHGGAAAGDTEAAILQAAGGGKPLGGDVRATMEAGFGADFSGVRVHQDAAAHDLSQKLNATAFTKGRDVFLSAAAPNVGTLAGQRLLAHELTHVLQQGAAGHTTTAIPLIQRQRDLAKGDTVKFSEDGIEYWGTVNERTTAEVGKTKYTVKEDSTGDSHEVYKEDILSVGLGEPLKEGEKLPNGTKVKVSVDLDELECTVTSSVDEPPEQFYDIDVEWKEGRKLPERFLQNRIHERRVQAKDIAESQTRAVKKRDRASITHFYNPKRQATLNAGEYVRPKGPIEITKHALGSGVYGIAEPNQDMVDAAKNAAKEDNVIPVQVQVDIDNPLVVQDEQHAEELKKLSKKINNMAQSIHNERAKDSKSDLSIMIKESIESNRSDLEALLKEVFLRAGHEPPSPDKIQNALLLFFKRYDDANIKFIDQPATIFLAEVCGFGGIYGDATSGINAFDLGSVAFIPSSQEFLRKTRSGVSHEFVK